ncbi:hypothetical protein E2C01_093424 [Portunus trituberculatus]|uniref:Uncharacterized protein n=1 Tax=Portunus trituberculatus TaxID=210409 RepID=A0A5B7K0H0_PORTR|nr:hypothetical protein [Portunus trituberculatus]
MLSNQLAHSLNFSTQFLSLTFSLTHSHSLTHSQPFQTRSLPYLPSPNPSPLPSPTHSPPTNSLDVLAETQITFGATSLATFMEKNHLLSLSLSLSLRLPPSSVDKKRLNADSKVREGGREGVRYM